MIRSKQKWNKSHCNPYNMNNNTCDFKYVLSISETPYIRNVRGPLDAHPFIEVDRLRTPIDKINFTINEYSKEGYEFIDTENFSCVNYQNYVPSGIFKKRFYYTVTCVAENKSGISDMSNKYVVNLLQHNESIQKIICKGTLVCGIPILCG